jgi:HlyD family secretion protein
MRVTCKIRPPRLATRITASLIGLSALVFMVYGLLTPTKASIRNLQIVTAKSVEAKVPASLDPKQPTPSREPIALASPGRIEGLSESIEVGAAVDGVVRTIYVREGEAVKRGQMLAELDCRDLQSVLPVSRAEAESLRQVRERLMRGRRQEEREAAEQATAAAKAQADQASAQWERSRTLFASDLIPRVSFEEARRDADIAQAQYQQALRNEQFVKAEPLAEEVARADADLLAAEERIKVAADKVDKCSVRAPMNGTVLRIILKQGESFSLVSPRPVLTMADLSGRRVRAEVDERDVGKVYVGAQARISSEAFSGKVFTGKVTRVASTMGRKSVLTGDPADKSDRDILEVVAELEPAATALPVGLRVTVKFGL